MTEFVALTRHRIDAAALEEWLERARTALAPMAVQPGCLGGEVCVSVDDPDLLVFITRWESVGAFRRGMSAFEVKLHSVPFLYTALDEPSAFEVLHHNGPAGPVDNVSARAADADTIGLGTAAAQHVPPRGL